MGSTPLARCPECEQPLPGLRAERRRKRRKEKETNRYDARRFVRLALKSGLLKRGPCQRAGEDPCSDRVEAHHYLGYAPHNWLKVQWLCSRHHRIADREQD
jgi:hypothetical protein